MLISSLSVVSPLPVLFSLSLVMMHGMRKMGAGNAVFDLKDSVTAAVVRPSVQAEGEESYYLLMPMRPSS